MRVMLVVVVRCHWVGVSVVSNVRGELYARCT